MARFYSVQIGSIYLTSDGTAGGLKAKTRVTGVEDLLQTVTGAVFPAIGGSVVTQLVPFTSGKQFEVQVETHLYKAQWDALLALINDALENDSTLTVIGHGDTGNFTVTVKPNPVKPFSAADFINNKILKPNFKFITV